MKCVILQPTYIPWRGYFHQIHKADVFVFYDDVQYDDRGWRNRNRIKTAGGWRWLTIPVHSRGCQTQALPINSIRIPPDDHWHDRHWKTLEHAYRRAPYFSRYAAVLRPWYDLRPKFLAEFTIPMTIALARELGIERTQFLHASDLQVTGAGTERLLAILRRLGASHYITGPRARRYLQEDRLAQAGITLEYMHYDYPEYPQLYPPYDPNLSLLDLLFMTGPAASKYIWDR